MRTTILTAVAATLLFTPTLAQTTTHLQGEMRGTMTCDASGQVQVLNTPNGQLVRFDPEFEIEEGAAAVVQHHDLSTGRVTTLGPLQSHEGTQSYAVPPGLTVTPDDLIIIHDTALDDDLASVELLED